MRRNIYWLALLLPALALAGNRTYEVQPVRDLNGWSQPNQPAIQEIRCTFDSALYAEAFIGQPMGTGHYNFRLDDAQGNRVYYGSNDSTATGWTWVRAYLQRDPANPMPPKGSDLILKISAASANDSVNWYADDGNPWAYGRMHVPGEKWGQLPFSGHG